MKKQLISAVGVIYVPDYISACRVKPYILGEIFYMRKTCILKRNVRKVIYRRIMPVDYHPIERIKSEMRSSLNSEIQRYYYE